MGIGWWERIGCRLSLSLSVAFRAFSIVFDDLRAAKNYFISRKIFDRNTMGKKSKRGVVKTSAKPHAAAGKGRSGRSGSVSEDGRSVASQDDHKSIDSAPIGVKPVVSKPPGNVAYSLPPQLSTNGGDKNTKDSSVHASIPITTAPDPVVKAEAQLAAVTAAVAAHKAAATAEKNGVWSGNLRDAVKADAEGPAVLDVTMNEDEDVPAAEPKVAALAAAVAEPVVQSRGFSLTEPAPKEAKSEKNECACVIL
jgi:hypothetical protein